MSRYLSRHGGTRQTPQRQRMRADQVENSAGGFVWEVDEWTRLRRFLILGSEGGSYYASERDLTIENIESLRACIEKDGLRVVDEIVGISQDGRAPKNDPALYALAACMSIGDRATKRAAAEALPKVARIGTHLYHFVTYAETMRGWGRTMRWAVSNWYDKHPEQLALQAVKYRQRDGWSHRDLLRLAHPSADDFTMAHRQLFDWITHGDAADKETIIVGFERAQKAETPRETAALVREYKLPREALKTEHLNEPEVWFAMLETGMPMTATVRNLGVMTSNGVLDSKEHRNIVISTLGNEEQISKSRIHPIALLLALRTYTAGRGFRGRNSWNPKPDIIDAVDAAFYTAFGNVKTTGKSIMLGLDVSGSMGWGNVAGTPLTPREAATAMALITLHAEPDVEVMAFSNTFMHLPLSRRMRLDEAVRMTERLPFSGTDCSLPMIYAHKKHLKIDAFVVYTDSETWAGVMHPPQALQQYREREGKQYAKLAVVGMVANKFSIADPNDAGMLDVVGFDTATPNLISDFISGRV